MTQCTFIKPSGERCGATAMKGYPTCYGHRSDLAEERRRNAARGGRSGGRGRAGTELKDVKTLCEDLTERVLAGDLLTGPAAVANQLINTRLRAIEQERKNRETEDLEVRVEALERAQDEQGGAKTWRRL